MRQAKCIHPCGYLTKDQIYTIVAENDKKGEWVTVIDDIGNCATYAKSRFEVLLTPKGSPTFSEMQHIADEVKVTQLADGAKLEVEELEPPTTLKEFVDETLKLHKDLICPVVETVKRRAEPEIYMSYKDAAAFTRMLEMQVDTSLADDEWHLIFPDYRDLKEGRASKVPWSGGSNMTSTFIVGRLERYKEKVAELTLENLELKKELAVLKQAKGDS
jgi:hypothetical protein